MHPEDSYDTGNVISSSAKDGWHLGRVGVPWPGPWPKKNGDLFVVDPEGWQAGIAWESSGPQIKLVAGPSAGRWGVYQVLFPLPVMSEEDLIRNFHLILPLLKTARSAAGSRDGR